MRRSSALLVAFVAVALTAAAVSVCADYHVEGQWTVVSPEYQFGILQWDGTPGPYGNDVHTLLAEVWFETESRMHLKISPNGTANWEVPAAYLNTTVDPGPLNPEYEFLVTASPFGFQLKRVQTGEVLVDTNRANIPGATESTLIVESGYLSLTSWLPDDPVVYGLGEHITRLQLPVDTRWTLWNKDPPGNPPMKNLYGSHPYYMRMDTALHTGNAHGVLLWNSNAMDVLLGRANVTYKTTGGVLDFYYFLGPSPAHVTSQYTRLVGKPYMPPLWSLGFHQCRWGYRDIKTTQDVVAAYAAAAIPLDTIWNDIDYMQTYYDFTLDPDRYPADAMKAFHAALAAQHQHHVYIVDPGIPDVPQGTTPQPYTAYTDGLRDGIFMRTPGPDYSGPDGAFEHNPPLVSRVWPHVNVSFPDFTHPDAQQYWQSQISQFFALGGTASGLWIDMNEPSSFCRGQYPFNCSVVTGPPWSEPNADTRSADLLRAEFLAAKFPGDADAVVGGRTVLSPYVPGDIPLVEKTLELEAWHTLGPHADVHNLFGYLEQKATAKALESLTAKRAFVLTRSTFAGSGSHGAHWTGDNDSTFESMRGSVPHLLSLGLFGIPFAGSDICGFNGNTTFWLCTRWFQLGALYPFSRNHNSWDTIPQEATAMGPELQAIAKAAIRLRYSLVSYLYTHFVEAHVVGTPVMRALFFEYPGNADTYAIDTQFMLGPALLASPVLHNDTQVNAYIPHDNFYSFYDGAQLAVAGASTTLPAPLDPNSPPVPLHVRGGHIVAAHLQPALTTYDTMRTPYTLVVALDQSTTSFWAAAGNLVLDDGESLGNIDIGQYWRIGFGAEFVPGPGSPSPWTAHAAQVTTTVINKGVNDISAIKVDNVTVYGIGDPTVYDCSKVTLNGVALVPSNGQLCLMDTTLKTLTLTGLGMFLQTGNNLLIPVTASPNPGPGPGPNPGTPLAHQPLFIWTMVGVSCFLACGILAIVAYRKGWCPNGCCRCCRSGHSESIGLLTQPSGRVAAHMPAGDL